MIPLSDVIKYVAVLSFEKDADQMGLELAKWASEVRDLETENAKLRLQLALLTEEG